MIIMSITIFELLQTNLIFHNLRVGEKFWLVVRKKFIGFAKHTAME